MLTFDEAMILTRTIGSHTSFEEEECLAYFDVLMKLPPASTIVEVGLEYGRSSSIALQVAKSQHLSYIGVDPFENHPEIKKAWFEVTLKIPIGSFRLEQAQSKFVSIPQPISAVLIDGDHEAEAVYDDLEHFAPLVVVGGYLMCHDFQRESLPGVTRAVNAYFEDRPQWSHLGTFGTLGIWRRLI